MIYNEISNGAFSHWLAQSDTYKDSFTYEGANALQEYLEDMSNDIGENIEFDPIAWCCEFTEYATEDIVEYANSMDDDEVMQFKDVASAINWLNDHTTVIEFDGGIIVQDF